MKPKNPSFTRESSERLGFWDLHEASYVFFREITDESKAGLSACEVGVPIAVLRFPCSIRDKKPTRAEIQVLLVCAMHEHILRPPPILKKLQNRRPRGGSMHMYTHTRRIIHEVVLLLIAWWLDVLP